MIIQVLLAGKADLDKVEYPVLATPKLDGIRCATINGVAMSRKMKPIPNRFVQEELKGLHGLDGELMVNGDYNKVLSAIMSADGEPDFVYHVFDNFELCEAGYEDRIDHMYWSDIVDHHRVQLLVPKQINNRKELDEYMERCLKEKYEGVMIRKPGGRYKFGRSTTREAILLKVKKFLDDEAIIVDIVEKMINNNPLEEDELGHAKRSSHKENKIPAGTAGAVIAEWQGIEFKLGFGPGITDDDKQDIWNTRALLIGQICKFRYQDINEDTGVPRFGKYLGLRHEDDL